MTKPPPPKSLRDWLRVPGRSQRKLAKRVGCNQSAISMIASGERAARGPLAQRIHKETGVPLERLIVRWNYGRSKRRQHH